MSIVNQMELNEDMGVFSRSLVRKGKSGVALLYDGKVNVNVWLRLGVPLLRPLRGSPWVL